MAGSEADIKKGKVTSRTTAQPARKKPVKPKRPPKQMPWVMPVNCEGCGECVSRCIYGLLVMTETNVPEVLVPWLYEVDFCLGDGQCTTGCAMGGIVMTSYVDMAKERFRTQKPTINTD